MLKNHDIGWPAVVLVSVALVSLATVLTFASENVQTTVIEWMGWAGLAASQFFGPILKRKVQSELDDEPKRLRSVSGAGDSFDDE